MKKVLIIGGSNIGASAMMRIIEMAKSQSIEIIDASKVTQSNKSNKALEYKLPQAQRFKIHIVKTKKMHIPKKLHPKHQKNNKYRFNK